MEAYVEAHDQIRLNGEGLEFREKVKRMEAEKSEDRRELQYLERALTNGNRLEEPVKELEKLK